MNAAITTLPQDSFFAGGGLELPPNLPFATWQHVGRTAAKMIDYGKLCLADAIQYALNTYNEEGALLADRPDNTNAPTLAQIGQWLNYEEQTIKNWAVVGRRIPVDLRGELASIGVPPSAYKVVAEAGGLTSNQREGLLREFAAAKQSGGYVDNTPTGQTITVPPTVNELRRRVQITKSSNPIPANTPAVVTTNYRATLWQEVYILHVDASQLAANPLLAGRLNFTPAEGEDLGVVIKIYGRDKRG